jgi:hypothetical protein
LSISAILFDNIQGLEMRKALFISSLMDDKKLNYRGTRLTFSVNKFAILVVFKLDNIWTMEKLNCKLLIYKGYFGDTGTENPRVGGSIPSRPTTISFKNGHLQTICECPFF